MVFQKMAKALPSRAGLSAIGSAYKKGGAASASYKSIGTAAASPFKALAESAKEMKKPAGRVWRGLTKNKSILGVNLGIGSLLKQSQVFTGAVSTIMQIIGAMVDVLIAPFIIPLFIPLAKKMVSFIPKIQEWSAELAEKYVPKIQAMIDNLVSGEGTLWQRIGEFIGAGWDLIWKDTGLSVWWEEQTGILGFFTAYLSGAATGVRHVYNFLASLLDGPYDNWMANIAWNATAEALKLVAPSGVSHLLQLLQNALEGKAANPANFPQVDTEYHPIQPQVPFKDLYAKSTGLGSNYNPMGVGQ